MNPDELVAQREKRVKKTQEEALELIASAPRVLELTDVLERLGCQCGRPSREEISMALSDLLTSGRLLLDTQRRMSLPSPLPPPNPLLGHMSCGCDLDYEHDWRDCPNN